LFRLHESLGLEIRRVGVFGRFGLHELRDRVPAASDLNHHFLIPEESGCSRHRRGAQEFEALAIIGGVQHGH
jgi:hypothetical protein